MELNDDAELVFENDIYVITVKVLPDEVLRVEAEQKSDGALWRGDFTSGYIEEITRKTGNCKKFSVFVKMLRSAILQDSDCVFVSLLTYYELEVLKARQTNGSQAPRDLGNNKRYLILTYVGEFDRVHYPLPLLYEDAPDPELLRRTIDRLKAEMIELKERLSQAKRERSKPLKAVNFPEGKSDARPDLCEDENCSGSRYEADKAHLVKEILSWKNKHKLLVAKYEVKKDCYKDTQTWKKKCDQLQEDLKRERNNHKKAVANLMVEKLALIEEMKQYRDGETRTRVKLRESESQLDHLKRKLRASARDLPPPRTPARSRRPSPQTKGLRSSSCPSFRPRSTAPRDQGARQTSCADPFLPRMFHKAARKSPQPISRHGSGRSSCSERSETPPLQFFSRTSPRSASCGTSPVRNWRGIPVSSNDGDSQRNRRDRRDESPGRILRNVKDKLAKFTTMQQHLDRSELSSVLSDNEDVTHRHVHSDEDIEARIEALQNFLHSKA